MIKLRDQVIKVNIRQESKFIKNSLEESPVSPLDGIVMLKGMLRGNALPHCQSFIFKKDHGWSKGMCIDWIIKQGFESDHLSIEDGIQKKFMGKTKFTTACKSI